VEARDREDPAGMTARAPCLAALIALALAAPARADLQLVDSKPLTARVTELTLRTDALAEDTHVRIMLPDGYDPSGKTRYPVLYLLHGCCDDYRSWTDKGDAEKITAGLPLVVVMPDGGQAGFYTDWYNAGAGGPPRWESYHVGQLIPYVDAHYPTIAARGGRAIAGLSMGGFGTMSYAARHPDLFVAAASFSGAVDNMDPGGEAADGLAISDGHAPTGAWGPRASEEVRWRAHNPVDLAENLRGLSLTVRTGNGQPGGPYGGGPDAIESGVHTMSTTFHQRLTALGLPHVWDDYGPGAHDWPYWQRDLRETLPSIMTALAKPPAPPSPFTFTAVEPRYEIYGWAVDLDRPVLEFSRLERASAAGFTLAGSGRATVTTPPRYRAGRAYEVTVAGKATQLAAGADRRLRVRVDLGAANAQQQFRPGADTKVRRASVVIGRVACTSRRRVTLRLPRGARRVTVLVDGRRRAVLRGARSRVTVSLAGRPAGAARVRLAVELRGGRTVHLDRRFRTCAP
jgi:S-formylglutathione hydrolase FrmB